MNISISHLFERWRDWPALVSFFSAKVVFSGSLSCCDFFFFTYVLRKRKKDAVGGGRAENREEGGTERKIS